MDHAWNRYMVAVAAALLAFGVRLLMDTWLGYHAPFLPFYFAVMAAAWYGGRGPGFIAGGLGLLLGAWFFAPADTPAPPGGFSLRILELVDLLRYVLVGLALCLGFGRLHHTRRALATEKGHRRAAEHDARQQAEQLRVTLLGIGEGVIATDAEGRVRLMNPVAEDLTGLRAEAATGRPLAEVFRAVDETSRAVLEVRVPVEGSAVGLLERAVLLAHTGTEHPVDITVAPVLDGTGTATGHIVVFRDVSAQREQERLLENASRRKDEFLATLAHELRNPLAPLVSGLELLGTKALLDHEVAQVHPILERQTNKLVRLVDDLMDLNRIERGAVELELGTIDLRDVVNDAMEASKPLAQACGHNLRAQKPLVPVYVQGDHARLVQVLTHLLDNACKFTLDHGVVRVMLEMSNEEAFLRVRDNGQGIPAEVLPGVFELFAQVDSGRKNEHSGLGIGLAVVKRLVTMHRGRVEVASEEGRGTEFTITLPLAHAPRADHALPEMAPDKEEIGHWRMMVVDDNRDAAALLGSLLRRAGHTVHIAYSGPEALEALPRFAPQVVIMDIGMPVMDGYETAMRMRQQTWGRSAVLIALSGWGQEEDIERSRRAGFDHHLVKPVEQDAVEELIAQLPDKAAPKRVFPGGWT